MSTKRFLAICGLVLAIVVLAALPVLADEGRHERWGSVPEGRGTISPGLDLDGWPTDLDLALVGQEGTLFVYGVLPTGEVASGVEGGYISFGDGTEYPYSGCRRKSYGFEGRYRMEARLDWSAWLGGGETYVSRGIDVFPAVEFLQVGPSSIFGGLEFDLPKLTGDPRAQAVAIAGGTFWFGRGSQVAPQPNGDDQVGILLNGEQLFSTDLCWRVNHCAFGAYILAEPASTVVLQIVAPEGQKAVPHISDFVIIYRSGDFSTVRYVKLDKAGWLRGRVVTATAAQYPVAGVRVCVGPKDPAAGPWSEKAVVMTGGDGDFAIYLPAGKHFIRVYGCDVGWAPVEIHLVDY